ncbi:MAG TPA: hypothetical protein VHE35_36375 [Kofleriaceae bacterium]|nr:hypothetical protein [Kofleriaceae bacterium]
MNRREFLADCLAVPVAGLAVVSAACGSDDAGATVDAGPPNCLQNGTQVTIFANHGHSMIVSIADIQAGADKVYELAGTDHTHMVTVTASGFGMLAGDQSVTVRSTTDAGHSHAISIACA